MFFALITKYIYICLPENIWHLLSIHFVVLSLLWRQHVQDWTSWTDGCYVSKSSRNENAWKQPLPSPLQNKTTETKSKVPHIQINVLFPTKKKDLHSDSMLLNCIQRLSLHTVGKYIYWFIYLHTYILTC